MELSIRGDRRSFYQWDTNQQLEITEPDDCREIHFSNRGSQQALICKVKEEMGQYLVDVPNILLQSAGIVYAYGFRREEDSCQTLFARSFSVLSRPKPEDYIYTETETVSYRSLEKRVEALEQNGLDAGAQLEDLIAEDMLPAVCNADGKILTDEKGNVILRY